MSSLPQAHDHIPADEKLLTLDVAAEHMRVPVTKLIHMVRDGSIIAVKNADGHKAIPALYLDEEGGLNRFVPGVTALLKDGGWSDTEILDYLYTEDDTLPGRPIDALHGHAAREVMRRAQAMAL